MAKIPIERRKDNIIKRYGREQTVGYYYYLWNAINYVGEDYVRESFESVQDLGDEPVIVGDYSSDDGTRELAEEYGFNVITIPKNEFKFAEAKVENAIIHNAKSNFLVDLSVHYKYPKIMDEFCRYWLKQNIFEIERKILIIRGKFFNDDGTFNRYACGSWMTYRPWWLEARGFDERGEYPWSTGPYGTNLLLHVWKLQIDEHYIGMEHKIHNNLKETYWRQKILEGKRYDPVLTRRQSRMLINKFIRNFDEAKKDVQNSYW